MKILGTGSYIPPIKLTNEELEGMVDTSAKWIEETLGIKERRISKFQTTSDIATFAGYEAIENSGLSIRDIDLIIVATSTPDMKAPSTACLIQGRLGARNAVCFDVNAVCSGFLYAMSIADSFLNMGTYTNALVIGADRFSTITDWTRRDSVFFGDGAGAVVFTWQPFNILKSFFKLYSDSRGNGFRARDKFEMNGRAVYEKAVSALPDAINEVLDDAGLEVEDIDMMIPHQPSIGILKETAKRIGLPFEKVKTNMDRYGNTAAATIPILMAEVDKSVNILKGGADKSVNILFAAMGSGWTWGAAILKI